jgi:hypothetical protein
MGSCMHDGWACVAAGKAAVCTARVPCSTHTHLPGSLHPSSRGARGGRTPRQQGSLRNAAAAGAQMAANSGGEGMLMMECDRPLCVMHENFSCALVTHSRGCSGRASGCGGWQLQGCCVCGVCVAGRAPELAAAAASAALRSLAAVADMGCPPGSCTAAALSLRCVRPASGALQRCNGQACLSVRHAWQQPAAHPPGPGTARRCGFGGRQ